MCIRDRTFNVRGAKGVIRVGVRSRDARREPRVLDHTMVKFLYMPVAIMVLATGVTGPIPTVRSERTSFSQTFSFSDGFFSFYVWEK